MTDSERERLARLMDRAAQKSVFLYRRSDYAAIAALLRTPETVQPMTNAEERERALEIVRQHYRHVELSPGVGEDVQKYALGVLDDVLNDLREPVQPERPQVDADAAWAEAYEARRNFLTTYSDEMSALRAAVEASIRALRAEGGE